MDGRIVEALDTLKSAITDAPDVDQKIALLNYMRGQLHEVSPLKHHPVDLVLWEKSTNVEENDYNPNHVDRKKMESLAVSIHEDGYTMPIVTNREIEDGQETIKIIDGKHRRKIERVNKMVSKSTFGYVPRTQIRKEKSDRKSRIASTVRHNVARGKHGIEPMADLVIELALPPNSYTDAQIAYELGMEADEVLRLKTIGGVADAFANLNYTASWEFQELSKSDLQ
jgi:ParB-like chromosome segregation protein Spo0J